MHCKNCGSDTNLIEVYSDLTICQDCADNLMNTSRDDGYIPEVQDNEPGAEPEVEPEVDAWGEPGAKVNA